MLAGAVEGASAKIKAKARRAAAHLLEVDPDDLEWVDGGFQVKGVPEQRKTPGRDRDHAAPVQAQLPRGHGERAGGLARSSTTRTRRCPRPTARTSASSTRSWGTPATSRWSRSTSRPGRSRFLAYAAVHDCGTLVNPRSLAGHIVGGTAQGIGTALYEEFVYDDDGQLLTCSFLDYLIPSAMEVPELRIGHVETPSPYTPHGIKGGGEGGRMMAPAAINVAVNDALAPLGVRVTELPMTPDRLRAAHPGRRRRTAVSGPGRRRHRGQPRDRAGDRRGARRGRVRRRGDRPRPGDRWRTPSRRSRPAGAPRPRSPATSATRPRSRRWPTPCWRGSGRCTPSSPTPAWPGRRRRCTRSRCAEWRDCLATDLDGVFLTFRAFIPALSRAGAGSLIAISSMTGKRPLHGRTPYAAAKMGVIGLVRTLAAGAGARTASGSTPSARARSPGPGSTTSSAARPRPAGSPRRRHWPRSPRPSPLGRLVEADEVAAACAFLASDAARVDHRRGPQRHRRRRHVLSSEEEPMQIIDLSQDIYEGMKVYPGHLKTVQFEHATHEETAPRFEGGFSFQTTGFMLNDNGPTHVDSFSHLDPDPSRGDHRADVAGPVLRHRGVPGRHRVQAADRHHRRGPGPGRVAESPVDVRPGDIVLFHTATWNRYAGDKRYLTEFAGLGRVGREWIVQRRDQDVRRGQPDPGQPGEHQLPRAT